jgi:hypothetical protein
MFRTNFNEVKRIKLYESELEPGNSRRFKRLNPIPGQRPADVPPWRENAALV